MNKYKNRSHSKFPQVLLFILSMAPFFIILGLMSMNIPISLDHDAVFIGWQQLWKNTWLGCSIIIISIVIESVILVLFQKVCKQESPEETEMIEGIDDINFELVPFVTSIFMPLISFQYDQLSHWLVTFLIVALIGFIFCNSDGFYTNPTLALFHYRLYQVTLGNLRRGDHKSSRRIIVLSQEYLEPGEKVRCVKLTDKVSCVTKLS